MVLRVCYASSHIAMPSTKTDTPTKHHIVVVDPEPEFLQWVGKHLEAPDVVVTGFSDPEKALAACKAAPPSLVIAEYVLKPYSGLDLLKKLKLQTPSTLVILAAGAPPNPAVIEAMRLGGYDFLRKSSLHYSSDPWSNPPCRHSKKWRANRRMPHHPIQIAGRSAISSSANPPPCKTCSS